MRNGPQSSKANRVASHSPKSAIDHDILDRAFQGRGARWNLGTNTSRREPGHDRARLAHALLIVPIPSQKSDIGTEIEGQKDLGLEPRGMKNGEGDRSEKGRQSLLFKQDGMMTGTGTQDSAEEIHHSRACHT